MCIKIFIRTAFYLVVLLCVVHLSSADSPQKNSTLDLGEILRKSRELFSLEGAEVECAPLEENKGVYDCLDHVIEEFSTSGIDTCGFVKQMIACYSIHFRTCKFWTFYDNMFETHVNAAAKKIYNCPSIYSNMEKVEGIDINQEAEELLFKMIDKGNFTTTGLKCPADTGRQIKDCMALKRSTSTPSDEVDCGLMRSMVHCFYSEVKGCEKWAGLEALYNQRVSKPMRLFDCPTSGAYYQVLIAPSSVIFSVFVFIISIY